ncbi:hypothetical protein CDAR_577741 [Caerostris darwini]|uniref:Uncharacterized protein n=1 Tax=Caerostris darwini TaxID=1538125 RepID=A0AAV4RHZ5_9ARAC|nr:hypothetical protein CDAR_577741 [Caerostris darwini]
MIQSEINISLASSIRINSDVRFNSLSSDLRHTAPKRTLPAQSALSSETTTQITRGSRAGTLCKRNFPMSPILGGDLAWTNNARCFNVRGHAIQDSACGIFFIKTCVRALEACKFRIACVPSYRFWRGWRKSHSRICHLSCIGGNVSGKHVVLEIKGQDNGSCLLLIKTV